MINWHEVSVELIGYPALRLRGREMHRIDRLHAMRGYWHDKHCVLHSAYPMLTLCRKDPPQQWQGTLKGTFGHKVDAAL